MPHVSAGSSASASTSSGASSAASARIRSDDPNDCDEVKVFNCAEDEGEGEPDDVINDDKRDLIRSTECDQKGRLSPPFSGGGHSSGGYSKPNGHATIRSDPPSIFGKPLDGVVNPSPLNMGYLSLPYPYTNGSPLSSMQDPEARELALSQVSPRSTKGGRKKKRYGKAEIEMEKRMHGEEYTGFGFQVKANGRKRRLIKKKRERLMGDPCNSRNCRRTKKRYCSEFPDAVRKALFKEFWSMDWESKKSYVRSHVDFHSPKFPRMLPDSKRGTSYLYYLKLDGVKRQVCKLMFLSTLGLKRNHLQGWLSQKPKTKKVQRVQRPPSGKVAFATGFLADLPKLPSHYCRASTDRMYLEPVFTTKMELYNKYKLLCEGEGRKTVCRITFMALLDELKISIYKPKKDECDTCVSCKAGNIEQDVYNGHRLRMQQARDEKSQEKLEAINGKCHVLVMDVQGVLLSPVLTASSLYYKTKLVVHNFTVYDLKTRQCTCYLWDESEGELRSSVFATCLRRYLDENLNDDLPIIIYSDGCTYQNRNVVLSNALLDYSIKKKKVIFQKYLERGYTQMEVDSVHSTIQRHLKGKSINLPTDYVTVCMQARKNPEPYKVVYMQHSDFKDFSASKHQIYNSIRPGAKTGDPQVTHIRQLKYTSDGKIQFKIDHFGQWTTLPRPPKGSFPKSFPKLYPKR